MTLPENLAMTFPQRPDMSLDSDLIVRLRDLASRGASVRAMVDEIRDHFDGGDDLALEVDRYFTKAFFLRLLDARNVEASACLGGNAYDDAQIDQLLLPLIAGTQHLWREEQTIASNRG
jgi:hypothetical protein